MKLYYEPVVSLISRPQYVAPAHIDWRSDSKNEAQQIVEFSGRLCYLSFGEGKIEGHGSVKGRTTNKAYINNILRTKHGSVIEHANWSLLFEGVSRSLTHELVRHRHLSYSQLSQRYVDEKDVAFVVPPELQGDSQGTQLAFGVWNRACEEASSKYSSITTLLASEMPEGTTDARKRVRQTARSVLPNCTETKIVTTGNARGWRFFLQKRGALAADTEIRTLAIATWRILRAEAPELFGDIQLTESQDGRQHLAMEHEDV